MTESQGTRWNGDNPLAHIHTPTYTIYSPTFSHRFPCSYSVMTIFFPLTLSGRPLFYYICFPDKKGMPSGLGGETPVGSVRRPFYPLQRVERYTYLPHNIHHKWTIICPFVMKTCHGGKKWETNGLTFHI